MKSMRNQEVGKKDEVAEETHDRGVRRPNVKERLGNKREKTEKKQAIKKPIKGGKRTGKKKTRKQKSQ